MEKLFSDFKPNTAAEWKAQLVKELKGEDYESLRWHNENGFIIEPFYTSETLSGEYTPAFNHSDWEITVKGEGNDARTQNAQLLRQLNMGASAISIVLADHKPEVLLSGINLAYIRASFHIRSANFNSLLSYLETNYKLADLNLTFFPETLGSVEDLNAWTGIVTQLQSIAPHFRCVAVNTQSFHDQNCLASYEVALIMAALIEYTGFYTKEKMPASDIAVKTGINSDYFMQIAKLRAIRRLWQSFKEELDLRNNIYLVVETSLTNKSLSDRYNNLLRTTMEAMGAVAGGCNELIISEFDRLNPSGDGLSERMAVNQQHILKNESYLDKMADVSCGSYYIESLTDAIAHKALEHFKRFERAGGYFECQRNGIIAAEIAEQAADRNNEFLQMKRLSIGVNKFRNEKEKITLSPDKINELKQLAINNPALQYELQHFFI